MKKTNVTDIVYKPFAEQIIKLMEIQIINPKKRWDEPFNNLLTQGMVTHMSYKDKSGNWHNVQDVYYDKEKRKKMYKCLENVDIKNYRCE